MDLSTLNSRQRESVTFTEGRIRVIAGAGSGKTRALAFRYAYIVNELGIDPANILCLTFTNKAAQEMKSRISQLVPPGYTNDFVCTIHGFCVRFLREEIFRLGYPKNFQILDEEDMKSLARQVLTENNTERSVKTVRQLIEALGGLKCDGRWKSCLLKRRSSILSGRKGQFTISDSRTASTIGKSFSNREEYLQSLNCHG